MALSVGVNSYVTVEQADDVLLNRLDVAAWVDATPEIKEKALITATSYLENKRWIGQVVDVNQALAWPRIGAAYFDTRAGAYLALDGLIPKRVIDAVIELAYHLLNNDGLLDSGSSAKSVTIGPISISNIQNSPKESVAVTNLLQPLLVNTSHNWWRAG